jgi:hypothetical protein
LENVEFFTFGSNLNIGGIDGGGEGFGDAGIVLGGLEGEEVPA